MKDQISMANDQMPMHRFFDLVIHTVLSPNFDTWSLSICDQHTSLPLIHITSIPNLLNVSILAIEYSQDPSKKARNYTVVWYSSVNYKVVFNK